MIIYLFRVSLFALAGLFLIATFFTAIWLVSPYHSCIRNAYVGNDVSHELTKRREAMRYCASKNLPW